jgi:hypothetical protein
MASALAHLCFERLDVGQGDGAPQALATQALKVA